MKSAFFQTCWFAEADKSMVIDPVRLRRVYITTND